MKKHEFLASFFSALHDLELSQTCRVEERYANVFILGLPRSGTTLISQVVYHGSNCQCTNNFMARFWDAPLVGACLSSLTVEKARAKDKLESFFGRTTGIDEPHEFSLFWHSMMGYSVGGDGYLERTGKPDWAALNHNLLNFNRIFGAPLVHKPLELIAGDLDYFSRSLQKSIFVFIDRAAREIAESIWNARISRGDVGAWFGSEPESADLHSLTSKSPAEQIAFQISYFRELYSKALEPLPKERKLVVKYEDLCADPDDLLQKLSEKSSAMDGRIRVTGTFEPFTPSRRSVSAEISELLNEALAKEEVDGYLY